MESITINQDEKHYEIESINPESSHIMKIVFVDEIPPKYGDINVYTAGGSQCSHLPGYATVYRDEGKTVYLSDNGSIYVPPEESRELPSAPYVPTPEELLASAKASKKAEVSAACEQIIYSGVNVTLADGTVKHFSLTIHDQLNLFDNRIQLSAGAEQLEYHADGQPFCYYSAADMQTIIQAARFHVSYHSKYCNALNMWIAGCQEPEEVQEIFYGADVPEEYRSEVLNAYLLQIAAMAGENADEAVS